jgi:Mn2+/Fe2+ NRAMP family transporter
MKEKISYPEPDKVLTQKPSVKKYLRYLLFFGPGAIVASMTIGQGQLILGPQVGAWAQFGLLWLITANFSSYIFCYIGTRFTMLSGINMMDIFSYKTKKGWFNWLILIIVLIFIPIFTATIITTVGQSLAWIITDSSDTSLYLPLGIGIALLTAFLVLFARYKFLERVQAFFVVVLGVGAIISVIFVLKSTTNVDYFDMILSFFKIGNVPSYPNWVNEVEGFSKTPVPMIILGYLGTLTISMIPLVGYFGWIKVKRQGIFKDKKDPIAFEKEKFEEFKKENGTITFLPDDPNEINKSKKLMIPLKVDLAIAFVIVSIVSACYILCGMFLLGPQSDGTYLLPSNIDLIEQQAVIFTSLSPILEPLFKISVFFAFFGTMYAGFEAAARMIRQTSKNIIPRIYKMEYRRYLLFLIIYILSIGIPLSILIFKGLSFMLVLSITLLFIGVICVLFYGIAVIYISQKVLPKKYKLGTFGLLLGVIGIILIIIPLITFIL